jgi:hypothetical protein
MKILVLTKRQYTGNICWMTALAGFGVTFPSSATAIVNKALTALMGDENLLGTKFAQTIMHVLSDKYI